MPNDDEITSEEFPRLQLLTFVARTVEVIPLLLFHLRHIFSLISKNIFRAILDETKWNVVSGTLEIFN